MRTIIAGSRTATKRDVWEAIKACPWTNEITTVVSGGAHGADEYGAAWANSQGIPVDVMRADWSLHGRAAGPIRNRRMADSAMALLAVWDGKSRGTANMIEEARARGLRLCVWYL